MTKKRKAPITIEDDENLVFCWYFNCSNRGKNSTDDIKKVLRATVYGSCCSYLPSKSEALYV